MRNAFAMTIDEFEVANRTWRHQQVFNSRSRLVIELTQHQTNRTTPNKHARLAYSSMSSFQANHLYLSLYGRGILGSYMSIHPSILSRRFRYGFEFVKLWGIFASKLLPEGTLCHAINKDGWWRLETKTAHNPLQSTTLSLIASLTRISVSTDSLDNVLNSVPVDGCPSARTGEPFECLVWVKDALTALNDLGALSLNQDVGWLNHSKFYHFNDV